MKANNRFRTTCNSFDYEPDIQQFPEGTKTALDAAAAVGCTVAQIVKSLVFIADDHAVLLLVSGKNRVDEDKIKQLLNVSKVFIAEPETVRAQTGFAIGGTPPFGHVQQLSLIHI